MPRLMGKTKKKKEEQQPLVKKQVCSIEKTHPVAFQASFLLILKMLDAGGTIHKAHKGCNVAAEKPFRFPGNSFC